MNLREILEEAKTWTLRTKVVKGKVVEYTLSAKNVEPRTFEVWGMISKLKE